MFSSPYISSRYVASHDNTSLLHYSLTARFLARLVPISYTDVLILYKCKALGFLFYVEHFNSSQFSYRSKNYFIKV